jgi:large subunit ribosomal protein L21
MYAIVKTGGKQYRVEEGQSLLVERLPVEDGGKAVLRPLLYVDGSNVVDGDELAKVTVEAKVLGHERGPKLRIVKFKPKRGYKRRTGHRQELTRIEVTGIKLGARRSASRSATKVADAEEPAQPTPVAADAKPAAEATPAPEAKAAAEATPAAESKATAAEKPAARKAPARRPAAEKPAAEKPAARKPPARKPRTPKPDTEEGNGA